MKFNLVTKAQQNVLVDNVFSWQKFAEELNLTSLVEKCKAKIRIFSGCEFLGLEFTEVVDCIRAVVIYVLICLWMELYAGFSMIHQQEQMCW